MNFKTGRPDHIEDYLVTVRTGQWFGWSDSKNKVYANLIIHPKIWNTSYTGKIHEEGMINNPYSFALVKVVDPDLEEFKNGELFCGKSKIKILKPNWI